MRSPSALKFVVLNVGKVTLAIPTCNYRKLEINSVWIALKRLIFRHCSYKISCLWSKDYVIDEWPSSWKAISAFLYKFPFILPGVHCTPYSGIRWSQFMAMENMFSKRSCRILFKNDIIKKDTDLIFTKFETWGNNSSMPAIFFPLKIWMPEYAMSRDTRTK